MKKVYFASDFHLGVEGKTSSEEREKAICNWLDKVSIDAEKIYLLGDVFDFWFDYKTVIPRGFIRLFGKLAELRDKNISIYFFTGNHDMWMFDYVEKELGIPIVRKPIIESIYGKKFFIAHGDGLGPGDKGYKRLKKLFANPIAQFLFRWIHPDIGIRIANYFSNKSRYAQNNIKPWLGADKEWLVQYCERKCETMDIDYFVFGHRHLPIDHLLSNGKSRYINLGDWLSYNSYAVLEEGEMKLET